MTVNNHVFTLEDAHEFHVLQRPRRIHDLEPVGDRFAVSLLDGWKVGCWAIDLGFARHLSIFARR